MIIHKGHIWLRHTGTGTFHVADMPTKGSVRTRCGNAWIVDPEFTEPHDSPPYAERCDDCQRALIDVARIKQGLGELVRNAPTHEDWPSAHDFDLGGES